MRNLLDKYAGVEFRTPDDACAWRDSHRSLNDVEKGRVSAWIANWEAELGRAHVERLNARTQQIQAELAGLETTVEAGQRRTAEVDVALRRGRMKATEGRREVTRLAHQKQQCDGRRRTLMREVERWRADADRSPNDILREAQDRFRIGAPHYGTRTLTLAILNGEGER